MSGNPLGVDLYHGAMLNVSVVNNTLNNNGGIELVPTQRNAPVDTPTTSSFSVARNIEINNNTLTNTSGQFSTFIAVTLQLNTQNAFWGESVIGVEVRNNKITARSGAPYYRNTDGYKNLRCLSEQRALCRARQGSSDRNRVPGRHLRQLCSSLHCKHRRYRHNDLEPRYHDIAGNRSRCL